MRRTGAAAIVAAAIIALVAEAAAETIRVEIKSLAFNPAQITARVGDAVEWVNSDFLAHTATAKNHDWDVQLPPGKTARLILKKPGTVDYFCRFHPNMTGTIAVKEARR